MGASGSGKREHQKLKAYLILQILQEKTDEEHLLTAAQIAAELDEMGIEAERRSIYRDIREINRVLYMLENGCTIQEAEELFPDDADPNLDTEEAEEEKTIVYDAARKGYYMKRRKYDLIDMRLMAESVYFSKFLYKS